MDVNSQKLGDYSLELDHFPDLKKNLDNFAALKLKEEGYIDDLISALLLEHIQKVPSPCFLLGALSEFIKEVNQRGLTEGYTLNQFEFWLNQSSGLSEEENYKVRGKISGKYIPRDSYQTLFPIGMGKKHFGSHYVTAHSSPDLDTTVASFWGWIDAFAARVGTGLHIWNVPGGPPSSQVETRFLFHEILGDECFSHFAKTRSSLALSAFDLTTQEGVHKKKITELDEGGDPDSSMSAVILTDQEGNFLSDWRQTDSDGVRKVTILVHHAIRWFASHFLRSITSLFGKKELLRSEAAAFVESVLSLCFEDADLAREMTAKQKMRVDLYLTRILGVDQGWKGKFSSLAQFDLFVQALRSLPSSALFGDNGRLEESRGSIFEYLDTVVTALEASISALKAYVEQLGVALHIKKEVFGFPDQVVSHRAEVEEVRKKLGSFSYLTVTMLGEERKDKPRVLGIVKASDLGKGILGTVSLRDFCNREETKIPSYFEVISVIDHHKSALSTASPPTAFIADAQSANTLVAEMAFIINDAYSTGGCCLEEIEEQLKGSSCLVKTIQESRILQNILKKHIVAKKKSSYFIDPKREYLEYMHFLYAILDDTDLLSKVSTKDVLCVASLLSRMKSIICRKEVEVISFDDLPRDGSFPKEAAKRILQNEEMYSLYQKVYVAKEEGVEEALRLCVKGEPSSIFADTKVQNVVNRVGQTKLFVKNIPSYQRYVGQIRALWYLEAKEYYETHPECDLHMQMISTVPSADDVYQGRSGNYTHQDELWVWTPFNEQAVEHLKSFLGDFRNSPQMQNEAVEVEFLGDNKEEFAKIFTESFGDYNTVEEEKKEITVPVAIIRYKAGLLNSRKAMISPYLPRVVK